MVDDVRVRGVGRSDVDQDRVIPEATSEPRPETVSIIASSHNS